MKTIQVRNIDKLVETLRPRLSIKNTKTVEAIISNIKKRGDSSLKTYEKRFSGASVTSLLVTKKEIQTAYSQVSKNEIDAIKTAKKRLAYTEKAVKNKLTDIKLSNKGIKISKSFTAIQSVGCYVPGGLARYPSSVVMSVVPAKIAGVKRIAVVSPPNKQGKIDPLTIVAADICGAGEIYKTGGAQAIAALAYGTKSIQKVDKIVGPGGPFVTLAKSLLSDIVSIDMIAGPTELGIIADSSTDPELIAVDLISQAEHSYDTFCYVITTSKILVNPLNKVLNKIISNNPRSKIIKTSLRKNGFIGICKTEREVIEFANKLAPEHLEIMTKNPKRISQKIKTSGLVLVGPNTPSSASDYLLGSNHILPTGGFGKTRGSLSVLDFLKLRTEIESSKPALKKLSKYMKSLTSVEGLPNHFEAVRSRI